MKREGSGISRVEAKWESLSKAISQVIDGVLRERGISKTRLADIIDYPQSAISDVFNEAKLNRKWSFPLLLLVCDELKIEAYEVLRAAQTQESIPWLVMRLAKTPPHTMDRLELIVQAVAPPGADETLLKLFYTAQMFEMAAPEYVYAYIDGKLSDDEVYKKLVDLGESTPEETPWWRWVKENLAPSKDTTGKNA